MVILAVPSGRDQRFGLIAKRGLNSTERDYNCKQGRPITEEKDMLG